MEKNQNNESKNDNHYGTRKITDYQMDADIAASKFSSGKDFNQWEAVHILDDIGTEIPANAHGVSFTKGLIAHIELLVKLTQSCDWMNGNPIVWMSKEVTGTRLKIGEDMVSCNERALCRLGVLTWNDSGNYKRYGRRDKDDNIMYAYGVSLAPLGYLLPYLREMKTKIHLKREERAFNKHLLSSTKGDILKLFGNLEVWTDNFRTAKQKYDAMCVAMRIKIKTTNEKIESWIKELTYFYEELLKGFCSNPVDNSTEDERNPSNIQTRGLIDSDPGLNRFSALLSPKRRLYIKATVVDGPAPEEDIEANEEPLTIESSDGSRNGREGKEGCQGDDAQQAAPKVWIDPERGKNTRNEVDLWMFCQNLPKHLRAQLGSKSPDWQEIIDLADKLADDLGFSLNTRMKACEYMGQAGAALAIILVEVKRHRGDVRSPGGYLHGMIKRAGMGELNLLQSIYGMKGIAG